MCPLLKGRRLSRSPGTTTAELKELCNWLVSLGDTRAAMESTEPYWKPAFNVLERSSLEPVMVNAAHVRGVPHRTTDINDVRWLAELLL
jgi:hypothetical protein